MQFVLDSRVYLRPSANYDINSILLWYYYNVPSKPFIEIQHVKTKVEFETHLLRILIIVKEDFQINACNASSPNLRHFSKRDFLGKIRQHCISLSPWLCKILGIKNFPIKTCKASHSYWITWSKRYFLKNLLKSFWPMYLPHGSQNSKGLQIHNCFLS